MPEPLNLAADLPYFISAFLLGYLLGSIPFGVVLTRLAGLGDIRKIGSGNIGATNVLRTGKRGLAAATLLLDGGKGALAVLLALTYGPTLAVIAAAGAFLGHLFPVWLRFKGGKGVATYMGIVLALDWMIGLMALGTWLVVAALLRYSSLAALIVALLTPAYFWFAGENLYGELMIGLSVLIYLRHHQNIRRLLTGTESKIGGHLETKS